MPDDTWWKTLQGISPEILRAMEAASASPRLPTAFLDAIDNMPRLEIAPELLRAIQSASSVPRLPPGLLDAISVFAEHNRLSNDSHELEQASEELERASSLLVAQLSPDLLDAIKSHQVTLPWSAYASNLSDYGAWQFGPRGVPEDTARAVTGLESELAVLRAVLPEPPAQRSATELVASNQEPAIQAEATAHLSALEKLRSIVTRAHPGAASVLRDPGSSIAKGFLEGRCRAFVMSIDVRRSTELMLKAKSAKAFASFMEALAGRLATDVLDEFGVLDKFTGDGLLAFFPDFFSGPEAGLHVVRAAHRAHSTFDAVYSESHDLFDTVLMETGLGIGIDYGSVELVRMKVIGDTMTVIGKPVVYACRFAGCLAGSTMANQGAAEQLRPHIGTHVSVEPTSLGLKHEGNVKAYGVRWLADAPSIRDPDWYKA